MRIRYNIEELCVPHGGSASALALCLLSSPSVALRALCTLEIVMLDVLQIFVLKTYMDLELESMKQLDKSEDFSKVNIKLMETRCSYPGCIVTEKK